LEAYDYDDAIATAVGPAPEFALTRTPAENKLEGVRVCQPAFGAARMSDCGRSANPRSAPHECPIAVVLAKLCIFELRLPAKSGY